MNAPLLKVRPKTDLDCGRGGGLPSTLDALGASCRLLRAGFAATGRALPGLPTELDCSDCRGARATYEHREKRHNKCTGCG